MHARLSPSQAQAGERYSQVGGWWSCPDRQVADGGKVDEVATVNQYEQVNLFPVLWLLRGSYHIYNHNKSANQRWKFTEIARRFPGLLLQTQRHT